MSAFDPGSVGNVRVTSDSPIGPEDASHGGKGGWLYARQNATSDVHQRNTLPIVLVILAWLHYYRFLSVIAFSHRNASVELWALDRIPATCGGVAPLATILDVKHVGTAVDHIAARSGRRRQKAL